MASAVHATSHLLRLAAAHIVALFVPAHKCGRPGYVMRDIDDVIAEIKHYIERYAVSSFQLYDLTAFTRKRWTVAFCQRLLQENLNIRWSLPSGTRSEVLDEEVLTLLKQTGCDYIAYAPESGSPATLNRIKKRGTFTAHGCLDKTGKTDRLNR